MGSKLAVFAVDFLLIFAAVAIAGSAWAMAPMAIMSITSYFQCANGGTGMAQEGVEHENL